MYNYPAFMIFEFLYKFLNVKSQWTLTFGLRNLICQVLPHEKEVYVDYKDQSVDAL